MSDHMFTANYLNGTFIICNYNILNLTKQGYEVVDEYGHTMIIPNVLNKIAFTKRSAILVLINSFNDQINNLSADIVDILYKQRHVQNAFERSIYYKEVISGSKYL